MAAFFVTLFYSQRVYRYVEVFVNREVVQQMVLLEHKADIPLVQFHAVLGLHFVNGFREEVKLALPTAVEHSKDRQQGGLACAGRPHDGDEVSLLDVQEIRRNT